MRWRGPKIKPSLSSLSTNNSHAYLFIIWSTPFKTEIIKCDTIFLFFCIVFAILQNLSPRFSLLSFNTALYRKDIRFPPLFVEKFPELNIYNIKQPTMFLSVLTLTGRYEWVSVQLSSRQKAKAEVLISFYYQKVCCLFTCCFVNNA